MLTAWIVGRTDRFRAAVTQKPVINWASTVLTTDVYTYMPKYWFTKPPWEDPEAYWKYSPLSLVGSVKTPTLVLVGDQDFRTPVSDSEQYYQALQLRGVPTGLVKVPGASHGGLTARPSQSAAKASAILAWFAALPTIVTASSQCACDRANARRRSHVGGAAARLPKPGDNLSAHQQGQNSNTMVSAWRPTRAHISGVLA